MLLPLDNSPEEKFGKQSAFHPMCCITSNFIDEGYSNDDLIKLYKKKIMQSDPLANHILTALRKDGKPPCDPKIFQISLGDDLLEELIEKLKNVSRFFKNSKHFWMFFKDPFKESCRYRNFHTAEFNKAFNKQKELYGTSNEPQVGLKIRPMPSLLWFIIYESSLQIEPPFRLKIAAFRSNQNIHVKWRISINKQHRRRIRMFQLSYHGIISGRDPRTRAGRCNDLRFTPRTPHPTGTKQCVDPWSVESMERIELSSYCSTQSYHWKTSRSSCLSTRYYWYWKCLRPQMTYMIWVIAIWYGLYNMLVKNC